MGDFGKNVGKNLEFTNGLFSNNPKEFVLGIIELNVCVGVQCDADVTVTHDILQCLRVHP